MSRILLQTTIPEHPDDWEITRFSLLADELQAAGHEVIARNRVNLADDDPVLSRLDELNYDQLSRRMADRWAERSPNRPSTTSPTTTGISIAGRPHSSPSRPAGKSRTIRPAWRSSRTTCATSRPGCSPRPADTPRRTVITNAYRPTSDLVREQEARYGATDGREGGTLEDRARGHPDDDHGAP